MNTARTPICSCGHKAEQHHWSTGTGLLGIQQFVEGCQVEGCTCDRFAERLPREVEQ